MYVPQNGQPATNDSNQGASSLPLDYYPGTKSSLYKCLKAPPLLLFAESAMKISMHYDHFLFYLWIIGSMRGDTTQKADYQDPHSGRMELNEEALNRVSARYIQSWWAKDFVLSIAELLVGWLIYQLSHQIELLIACLIELSIDLWSVIDWWLGNSLSHRLLAWLNELLIELSIE